MAASSSSLKFRNRSAVFGWGFMACFLIICAMFTYLLVREGPGNIAINPPENMNPYPPWVLPVVNLVFWMAGIAAAAHFWRIPCQVVEVQPDRSVVVTSRYPFGSERRHIPNDRLRPARVLESHDSEGDPYFECKLSDVDGFSATIAENSSREYCESVCDEFNEAIGRLPAA